ncbi:FAD-binding oxidoreductase [Nonomuraea sp. NEAU-A123]|uniref:NAD(P)/FAD-dependent oxidoreductase n=1 Tax=Nonomuraea sp. NEAU-A123 TaxID=2839649 RepID=UPI001BE4BB34|nr:FAD-binding oxidoreductase [Nonomuraea sp. NEAU-A123]MBT2233296.1 FAD-binding oxidoreductase [Nonomuraea sp. NEAU-A123]
MTDQRAAQRVIVLGGGILGVSTAVHLVRGGAEVVLVTEAELASGASGRSLSWLNSAGTRPPSYHLLRLIGIDRYRTLFAADPAREWLRFDGGLWWTTPDGSEKTRARHAHEVANGYESHLVDRAHAGRRTGGVQVGPSEHLAIHNAGEGWVSLPHLIQELADELVHRGGQIVTGAGHCSVTVQDGRARGVSSADGTSWRGDAVVVACGAQTSAVLADLGVDVPDGSPLSMLVITEPVRTEVTTVLNTPRAAMRPHPESRFAIDHSWYEEHIVEHEDGSCSIDEIYVKELVAEASALLDGDISLEAASWKLGRKPIPGDGQPVFGELEAVPGCHVAFTHSGATLGLIAGELTAYEVLTGVRHPLLKDFRPERFTQKGAAMRSRSQPVR